jgi:hypothetical protein
MGQGSSAGPAGAASPAAFRPCHKNLIPSQVLRDEAAMVLGQLFSRETQAIFYNFKEKPVQRMLDFDFVAGQTHMLNCLFAQCTATCQRVRIMCS